MTIPEPLNIYSQGNYDIRIAVEPGPNLRGHRTPYSSPVVLANIYGGNLLGSANSGNFEINTLSPAGVTDADGDRLVLSAFEFHSFQLATAAHNLLYFDGYLSAVEAYKQAEYDILNEIRTEEDYNKVYGLNLNYMPPTYAPAQEYLGWKARVAVVPCQPAS